MALDLLFTGARVVDGTGAPWFRGSVGVRDGRLGHVSTAPDPEVAADVVLDLDGLAIAPGFIDAHTHSDLAPFVDPTLEPKVRQGVTTEVLGQDGLSMAPVGAHAATDWARYVSGLVGSIDEAAWTWGSTADYLDALERAGPAINLSTLVGHGTVRYEVLGMTDGTASGRDLEEMEALVARSLEAGALGLSTGLVYAPQPHADTEELRRLASQLRPTGRPFVAHIRSYGRELWTALDEFVDIGASEGVPVHLSHFKLGSTKRGLHDRALELARAARDRGIDFTADLYPYVPGSTMLQASLPDWVHVGGPDAVLDRLEDPDDRERIRREMAGDDGRDWATVQISHVGSAEREAYLGRTVADIAESEGADPVDLVCDLLLAENLEVTTVSRRSSSRSERDIRAVIAHELVAIGSDSIFGKHPHPRLYGTYPRVLGRYVRELHLLSLEEAVRKMTSLPARIYGLSGKGLLRPGMDADIVVFDPLTVGSPATFDDPRQYPTGIVHVVVGGTFVVRDGGHTGATPGGVIRR